MVNYRDTFIAVSEDCRAEGAIPQKIGSVAETQYRMLVEEAYRYTQEDVLFASSRPVRSGEAGDQVAFFERPQACLRCSPLVKTYGWGLHFDADGRAAAFAVGSDDYRRFVEDSHLVQTQGMRSRRASSPVKLKA